MRCVRRCYRYNNMADERKISPEQLEKLRIEDPNLVLLDVRSPQEYAEGHMRGSICLPSYDISYLAEKIIPDKEKIIITYCAYGQRSKKAADILKTLGYKNVFFL